METLMMKKKRRRRKISVEKSSLKRAKNNWKNFFLYESKRTGRERWTDVGESLASSLWLPSITVQKDWSRWQEASPRQM
ncbi:hypothetical protein R1flu_023705 [Riccia fluitans]|uniref:Uncharacterized protein n=1 Tax=Riccia fluitans TaxID=41844 RepID=A0ABD1XWV5_9MARC